MKSVFRIAALAMGIALTWATAASSFALPSGAPLSADGGQAQRLVAILDYIGADYAGAVRDGQIVDQAEYEEQLQFAADARALVAALLDPSPREPNAPQGADDEALRRAVADVEARVRARAPVPDVASACRHAREAAVKRFDLKTGPAEPPSLPAARALYAQSCAACHGERGDARTERALLLDPPPVSFRDADRRAALSPYRVYNTLTFGVPGTAMAAFDSLSPAERWSLAFFVMRLGHEGAPLGSPTVIPLAEQATRSDAELLAALRAAGRPDPERALAYVRREAAFQGPAAVAGLDETRRLLALGVEALAAGRAAEADGVVIDAYLHGFEPIEPRLRARDAEATAAVEKGIRRVRVAIDRGDVAEARRAQADVERALERLGEGRRAAMPLLAAFLIYFREGVEAALLIGALLAGVRRLGRPEAARYVHAGWMAALPAGLLTWWATERLVAMAASHRELTEAVIALVAAAVLFSMSFWMISRVETRRWTGYLRRGVEESLGRKNLLLLAGVSFLAVYREAVETVLFTQALLLDASAHALEIGAGALAGLLAVAVLAILMSRAVVRLPLSAFFAVSGALLCALAISFAGSGLFELVSAGYLRPRPVPIPEVPWMGIHADLAPLAAQLAIVATVAAGAVMTLRRRAEPAPARPPLPRNGAAR